MVWQHSSHSPDAKNWTRCVCNIQILESTYISPTQDGDWVQFMARANNATRMSNYEPIAVVLELPAELKPTSEHPIHSSVALTARERFVKEIRSNISNNRAVVIKGCCFSQFRGSAWRISAWYGQLCRIQFIGMVCACNYFSPLKQSIYSRLKCISYSRCDGASEELL